MVTDTLSIDGLVEQYRDANRAYRDGKPIMSDSDYDQLEEAIRASAPNHPCLAELADDEFGLEQSHTIPMGSQLKALTLTDPDLAAFTRRVGTEAPWAFSLKCDGMSAELTYVQGRLVQALTRGDGRMGVNITDMVRQISTVPETIPHAGRGVVRGEIMLPRSHLALANERRTARGEDPFVNTRNGTVAVKHKKNWHLADLLDFRAFDLVILD